VYDAVSDGVDFVERAYASVALVFEDVEDKFNGGVMLGQVSLEGNLLAVGQSEFEEGAGQSQFLYPTLRQDCLAVHIEKFVFDGRASAVQN
jgi:hypothetical protein